MQKNVKLGLAYLFPIIGPLIVLFAVKDHDEEDRHQIGQALALNLAMVIAMIVLSFLGAIPFLGFVFSLVNRLLSVVPLVLGILYFMGKTFEIPVFYDLGKSLVASVK